MGYWIISADVHVSIKERLFVCYYSSIRHQNAFNKVRHRLKSKQRLIGPLCGSVFVGECMQNVERAFRTAAATSRLPAFQTDTRPTCTASGGYQSHQEKRYDCKELGDQL